MRLETSSPRPREVLGWSWGVGPGVRFLPAACHLPAPRARRAAPPLADGGAGAGTRACLRVHRRVYVCAFIGMLAVW